MTSSSAPLVEQMLSAAHEHFAQLQVRRQELAREGVDQHHLPDDGALEAFAMLGNHDRGSIIAGLDDVWQALRGRGLACGSMARASTPELRLLAHMRSFIWTIPPIELRLRRAEKLEQPTAELWHCPELVRGDLGQMARVHFTSHDPGLRYLLIDPDPTLRAQPILWEWPPATGWFALPVNRGSVRLTLLYRDGRMFRMRTQTHVTGGSPWMR